MSIATLNAKDRKRLGDLFAKTQSGNGAEADVANRKLDEFLTERDLSRTDLAEFIRSGVQAAPAMGAREQTAAEAAHSSARDAAQSFSDFMANDPDFKARRTKREREQADLRASLVAKYGSEEAAKEPCERERKLIAATAHLVREKREMWNDGKYHTYTTIDGWKGYSWNEPPSAAAIEAVSNAYPLPKTITEAVAEKDYWEQRNREWQALLHDQCGDDALSLPCLLRQGVVDELIRNKLPATSPLEVGLRLKMLLLGSGSYAFDDKVIQADLERLQLAPPRRLSRAEMREAIADVLRKDPSLSDREIARRVGTTAPTVGSCRRQLGLDQPVRIITRCGKEVQMDTAGITRAHRSG